MSHQRFPWAESLVVLALTGLPYILAVYLVPEGHLFGGFLFNPIDGNSYLAKMYQGYQGAWQFRLPYTASSQPGPYLFLFYLALGHLSRIMRAPLLVTFHLVRLIANVGLMLVLWRFLKQLWGDDKDHAIRLVYVWILLGSGLGWLSTAFGLFTADFMLAEGYPFLSMYANPHFPLGITLLLLFFTRLLHEQSDRFDGFLSGVCGVFLGIILPFGVLLGGAVAGVYTLWRGMRRKRIPWYPVLAFGLGGGLVVGYEFWSTVRDPLLRIWNEQNQTPSPAPWNYLIAFSPGLLMAMVGIWAQRREDSNGVTLSILWIFLGFVLAYLPFNLQRRMLVGIYIPLVIMAEYGITFVSRMLRVNRHFLRTTLFILSLPTNGLIIALGLVNVHSANPIMVLYPGEREIYHWIEKHTQSEAVVLAAPETGSVIPAYTGRRVLYGHPFETVEAEVMLKQVVNLLEKISGNEPLQPSHLQALGVNYILWGPRERALTHRPSLDSLKAVFQEKDVILYEVSP